MNTLATQISNEEAIKLVNSSSENSYLYTENFTKISFETNKVLQWIQESEKIILLKTNNNGIEEYRISFLFAGDFNLLYLIEQQENCSDFFKEKELSELTTV